MFELKFLKSGGGFDQWVSSGFVEVALTKSGIGRPRKILISVLNLSRIKTRPPRTFNYGAKPIADHETSKKHISVLSL